MTLQAIIVRADGAFAETEELRRQAFITAFGEAGFSWDIDREHFAGSRRLGSLRERMTFFVHQYLKRGADAPDIGQLVSAMHRRACKVFAQLLEQGRLEPRDGIRELVVTARQEGVRLALAGALKPDEAKSLLVHALGSRGPDAFDRMTLMCEADESVSPELLYRQTLADLGIAAEHCLVIEGTVSGALAAKALGLAVVMTRSAYCLDNTGAGDSAGFFEDLPSILARSGEPYAEPLGADQRAELFSALRQLHSGSYDCDFASTKGATMRVSDILKIKGSAVKTIEPAATIRALAQGLRLAAVGGMVVQDKNGVLHGIITERDLARGLAEYGNDLPSMPVSALMTKTLITCAPEDSVATVAKVMTHRRIRHLPVVVNGALVGLISIGDVLKHRLDEVQL
ncbi:MAG: CBS domain-containing protein, partial [Hyphomicrobium sp.]